MTEDRARPAPGGSTPRDAGVTGVAKGSLGTGTALEETQVWDTAELQAAAADAEAGRQRSAVEPAQSSAAAPPPSPVVPPRAASKASRLPAAASLPAAPAAPASASAEAPAARPAAQERAVAEPVRPRRTAGPSPRIAGIAAAALLAVVAGIAILSSAGTINVPGAAPPAANQATPAPTEVAPPAADEEGDAGDGGEGNGNKDKDNGNGKGNGNGRGNN